ncbi:hypothetical protein F7725_001868 [Dissostichus mawsoni]|uniref:Receptor-type tyrosine-protein phosphatase-like N n=1 Tax=Dissostichus mawsoni TaxID=36200 RepID=A0A7J5Y2L8_DISMA|nr:hypothetical protein F7725_001868 [Dissostichus mawsoni]
MQHLKPWRTLLLLTVLCHPGTSNRYGCLFERKLCTRDQFCSDDGLFGQCLSSRQNLVQYQVTVPVLKRMQEVLKQLMVKGFSWQDDITQYILSKELKRVPHTTHPSKPKSSSSSSVQTEHPPPHSSKSGSAPPGGNYLDYMIVEPPQTPLRMQTASMDPYTYHQHRYQDEVERSLIGAGNGYPRPSSRSQANQRERERDRQLLQEAFSLHMASAQPSYRHRGAAPAAMPYYEDLEMPVDYVEDYTLEERLGTAGRQQPLQNKKVPQDISTQSGTNDGLLQRMSGVLQRYGVDPRELSQEQLYKLALILQLMQAKEKTEPMEKDLLTLKEMQRLKTDSVAQKPAKPVPVPVPGPPEAPPAPSSASVSVTSPAKSVHRPPSTSQPPQAAPAEAGKDLKEQGVPLVEGTGAKEQYGYIVTNQSPLSLYDGFKLLELLADKIHLSTSSFINISVVGPALTFRIRQNEHNMTAAEVAAKAVSEKNFLESETGLKIKQTGVGERIDARGLPQVTKVSQGSSGTVITLVSMAVVGGVLVLAMAVACFRHHAQQVANGKLGLGPEGGAETHFDYQAYMEDHLRNKDRLQREWEALCSYQADPCSVAVAQAPSNMDKNRHAESIPYDHTRVKLKTEVNSNKQDFINASLIFDHDPRQPSYIATQGPMAHTVADFWQVNLVSEHIWCKDFLVRSFYLKNVQTQETRTLTQFHLLSWPADGIPTSTRPLLDFRRKVNKCYRGRSCPIIVHCGDGTSRTGAYILIDMVLNRMAKGVKEIDIAAALEHIRDQRPGLVRTKDQFEFALTAVAEEVNAILKALPQ